MLRDICLLILSFCTASQTALAQTPIDSVRAFGLNFTSSVPFGLHERDLIDRYALSVCRVSELTLRIDSLLDDRIERLAHNKCGRSCVDIRIVFIVFRTVGIDTLSFGHGGIMVHNGNVYDRDDQLLCELAPLIADREIKDSIFIGAGCKCGQKSPSNRRGSKKRQHRSHESDC
jgi:hypothetical protein